MNTTNLLEDAVTRDADTTWAGTLAYVKSPLQHSVRQTALIVCHLTVNPITEDVNIAIKGAPDLLVSQGGAVVDDYTMLTINNAAANWQPNAGGEFVAIFSVLRHVFMRAVITAVPASTAQTIRLYMEHP